MISRQKEGFTGRKKGEEAEKRNVHPGPASSSIRDISATHLSSHEARSYLSPELPSLLMLDTECTFPHPGLFPPGSLGTRHTWEPAQAGSSLALELKEA